jgi:hypothetical protein
VGGISEYFDQSSYGQFNISVRLWTAFDQALAVFARVKWPRCGSDRSPTSFSTSWMRLRLLSEFLSDSMMRGRNGN